MNKKISTRVKAFLAAGITLVTFSACGESAVIESPGYGSNVVIDTLDENSFDETSINEVTSVNETTVKGETTTTTETTVKGDETTMVEDTTKEVEETTVSGTKNFTDISAKNNSTTSKTTSSSTAKNNNTSKSASEVEETTNYVETTTYVEETTKRTTRETTTKAPEVTTQRETTTEVVTEAPRTDYQLVDICNDFDAFEKYSIRLCSDLMSDENHSIYLTRMSYCYDSGTAGGLESYFVLAFLNKGYISDEVLASIYSSYPKEEILHGEEFFYNLQRVQGEFGHYIDFTKYTLDQDVGNYLNQIRDSYVNGTFDEFMTDQIINGNIDPKFLNNTAILTYICGCDPYGDYLCQYDVEVDYVEPFVNHISEVTYGYSLVK